MPKLLRQQVAIYTFSTHVKCAIFCSCIPQGGELFLLNICFLLFVQGIMKILNVNVSDVDFAAVNVISEFV
jgi:hypothetical protein